MKDSKKASGKIGCAIWLLMTVLVLSAIVVDCTGCNKGCNEKTNNVIEKKEGAYNRNISAKSTDWRSTISPSSAKAAKGITGNGNNIFYVYTSKTTKTTNKVGSEWTYEFKINGTEVTAQGQRFAFNVGDNITMLFKATEHDTRYNDEGSVQKTRRITQSDIDNGFSVGFTLTVTENDGSYKGRSCVWEAKMEFRK